MSFEGTPMTQQSQRPAVAESPGTDADPYEAIITRLEAYAQAAANCLLIGERGVGKTSIVCQIAGKLGLRLASFSAPTLDPWADLIGLPLPREEHLAFLRPAQVTEAEVLLLDELNRAHPRVQNAVLELTLFKSLNGQRLPHLRMVWAAINPPGAEYQVEELDPALLDRFLFQEVLPYRPSQRFFQARFPESVAEVLLEWWNRDLDDAQRKAITPRRLAGIGDAYLRGLPLVRVVPYGATVPLHLLVRALNRGDHLRLQDLLQDPGRYRSAVREDLNLALRLIHLLDTCTHAELFTLRELILDLPAEALMSLRRRHNNTYQKLLKAIRMTHGHSRATEYDRKVKEFTDAPR
jgi:hypothetical protein